MKWSKFLMLGLIASLWINNNINTKSTATASKIQGPYTFGSLSLGIYASDAKNKNYVYFTGHGMNTPNFVPTDIFMTYDGVSKLGNQLNSSTPYMLSLISGNLYNRSGSIVGDSGSEMWTDRIPDMEAGLNGIEWSPQLKNWVNKLQTNYLLNKKHMLIKIKK